MIEQERDRTIALSQRFPEEEARQNIPIPPILGIDPEMQEWNLYQVLEHNRIVNRRITAQLAHSAGIGPKPDPDFDPKRDVMPAPDVGPEALDGFARSVADHLALVESTPRLRGTPRSPHPLFGPFDAHKWHCMFGFHLRLHRRQIEALARRINGIDPL